jgi:acyl-CoA thioester hydrolase
MVHEKSPFPAGHWSKGWFEYPVKVYPHHTDYAGLVWHGTYLTWMEEARIGALRSIGLEYADLVDWGCDLLVMELALRYRQAVRMGAIILVRTKMRSLQGARIDWDYELCDQVSGSVYLTAVITLAAVDRSKGKIIRRRPPQLEAALHQLWQQ